MTDIPSLAASLTPAMREATPPCRFCGSTMVAPSTEPGILSEGTPVWHDRLWFVECEVCGAKGPRATTKREAWEAWGRNPEGEK